MMELLERPCPRISCGCSSPARCSCPPCSCAACQLRADRAAGGDTSARVAALAGPDPTNPGAYWRALAAWPDWSGWVNPEKVDCTPDWRQAA